MSRKVYACMHVNSYVDRKRRIGYVSLFHQNEWMMTTLPLRIMLTSINATKIIEQFSACVRDNLSFTDAAVNSQNGITS